MRSAPQQFPGEPNVPRLLRAHALLGDHPDLALEEFKALAELGSLSAMVHLGNGFERGKHWPANTGEAVRWYQQAADRGLLAGYYYLGRLYLKLSRHDEAFAAFRHAAAAEYPPALHWLGRMYFFGTGIPKDIVKSRSYLERATRGGNLLARILLAKLLAQNAAGLAERSRALWLRWSSIVEGFFVVAFKGKASERFK
jgi:TPR repeat protein